MRISDWSSDVCSSDLHAGGIMETELVLGIYIGLQGRKFALLEEGDDDFLALAVLRNGEDLHFPTLFDRQLIQHRHFDHARSAPRRPQVDQQIGRAHVCTPVTNANLVCRLMLDKKKE